MAQRSLADMEPGERRRAIVRIIGRVVVVWVVFIGGYFIYPVGDDSVAGTGVKLSIDIILLIVVIVWQVRRIFHAEYPELRAIEALGVILAVFLVLFSALYLSVSHASSATFTQPLDHMGALYFTVTVFSTVGFGDITAKTDGARALVSVQMILDLILIASVARLLVTAARTSLGSRGHS
jgi:hypothetical protein